jgi:hypothetical protein
LSPVGRPYRFSPFIGAPQEPPATMARAPIGEVIRGILPFLILLLIVLAIITYRNSVTAYQFPNIPDHLECAKGEFVSCHRIKPSPN